jgi:hypothetical protein
VVQSPAANDFSRSRHISRSTEKTSPQALTVWSELLTWSSYTWTSRLSPGTKVNGHGSGVYRSLTIWWE